MDTLRDMRRVRVGAPDPSLTPVSGLAAVTELVDRLNMITLLDAAIGPIKTRDRGFTGGELLVGMATAQLAGEDFLVGLDRRRADPHPPPQPTDLAYSAHLIGVLSTGMVVALSLPSSQVRRAPIVICGGVSPSYSRIRV